MEQKQGVVYKSVGKSYYVKDDNGNFWTCNLRGKLRLDKNITSSNPIAVGDFVDFEVEDTTLLLGRIKGINERDNYIVRISPQNRKYQKHIIASNIHQAILIATFIHPETSLGFIDRFLITCEAYHIKPILLFNKKDLLEHSTESMDMAEDIIDLYRKIGYDVYFISALKEIQLVDQLISGKRSLLFGHSGVGKSTILNALFHESIQKVQEVSDWTSKGKHTTTFAEMFDRDNVTQIIDTPGIKEFGLVDMELEELSHYFAEMKPHINECKFNNCLHENEPNCAIKRNVAEGHISEERYMSYLSILDEIRQRPVVYL